MGKRIFIFLAMVLFILSGSFALANTYFVSPTTGLDESGRGSLSTPYKTVEYAVSVAADNRSRILVMPGVYDSFVIDRYFQAGVLIAPYKKKTVTFRLKNPADVVGSNITISGFLFTREDPQSDPHLLKIHGKSTNNITLIGNDFLESYSGDLLQVTDGANNITIQNNSFENQGASSQMIDLDGVWNVLIKGNDFQNDYLVGDSRRGESFAMISVKDSAGVFPLTGSNHISIESNRFEQYLGNSNHGIIQLGGDGTQAVEASDVMITKNKVVLTDSLPLASVFTLSGTQRVLIANNLVTGENYEAVSPIGFGLYGLNTPNDGVMVNNNRFINLSGGFTEMITNWVDQAILNLDWQKNRYMDGRS